VLKKLEARLAKYEAGNSTCFSFRKANRKNKKLDLIRYGKAGLLMWNRWTLPHLITDGRWSHSGEFVIPGLFFLYIAGWIGWVGRSYVVLLEQQINQLKKKSSSMFQLL